MTTEETKRTMARYFELMAAEGDLAESYASDVTWLIADTGEVVHGPDAVRSYVTTLHAHLTDMQTRNFSVGEEHAYLEGDCASEDAGVHARTRYCVAYDIEDGSIAAMRCYGLGARPAS